MFFKYLNILLCIQVIFICYTAGAIVPKKMTTDTMPSPPPIFFPDNTTTHDIVRGNLTALRTQSLEAPHDFPENKSIPYNEHLLKAKQNSNHKNNTEVADLMEPALLHNDTSSKLDDQQIDIADSIHDPESDFESIESDVSKTEDRKLNITAVRTLSAIHMDHGHMSRGGGPMVQGQLAAIFAGIFAMIAIFCYFGLLTWRRYLENRYGNREMLINEDEYINYNDMKNFEL